MIGSKCFHNCHQFLLIILIGYIANYVTTTPANAEDCKESESSILCHSTRVVKNVFKSMQNNNLPLTIIPGLEIVRVPSSSTSNSATLPSTTSSLPLSGSSSGISSSSTTTIKSNSLNNDKENVNFDGRSNYIEDDTFVGRISNYMQNHELKIKFSDLLDKTDFKDALLTTLKYIDDGKEVVEGRKKDKGGMGGIMIMGLMMGKMMAALGLGGVGALAMKALGVSMMALLLAGIIGIKKLADSGHDDGHHVQYITAHESHHRKRRGINITGNDDGNKDDIPLPYRGWTQYATSN